MRRMFKPKYLPFYGAMIAGATAAHFGFGLYVFFGGFALIFLMGLVIGLMQMFGKDL